MCDRIGCTHFLPKLSEMDLSGAAKPSRRGFLKGAAAAGTISMGFMGTAHAGAPVKSTHGSGFSNLNYFEANALQTAKDDGVMLDFVITPTFAEQVTSWAAARWMPA